MATTGASIWLALVIVAVAGAIGGAVNAYLTDNGFVFKKNETVDGTVIVRPGFLGSMSVGAIAAVASWGLYGPFASANIIGSAAAGAAAPSLTLSGMIGGLLVGAGGGRWITDHVDKQMLKAAAVKASTTNPAASAQIAIARPAQALHVARSL